MAKKLINEKGEFPLTFTANGRKYRRITEAEGIGPYRFTILSKLATQAQLGMNVRQILEVLGKVKAGIFECVTAGESAPTAFFRAVAQMEELDKAIRGEVVREYHIGFYLACVFIVLDGEDVTTYDEEVQQSKIEDWNKENYDARDFFGWALNEASKHLKQ